jgi:hypothetical protein
MTHKTTLNKRIFIPNKNTQKTSLNKMNMSWDEDCIPTNSDEMIPPLQNLLLQGTVQKPKKSDYFP